MTAAAESACPEAYSVLAESLFGDRLHLAQAYAQHLATSGVERGLIGPREVSRLWERHILNCALLARTVPQQVKTVGDVGSGAGLPGLVLAIARPDLEITLIETMLRRTTWLAEVVADLQLSNVEIKRNRAEELHGEFYFDAVTARAVAALDKLAKWCLPLVKDGGYLLAMKGLSAGEEITAAEKTLRRLGGENPQILVVGEEELPIPTRVVQVKVNRETVSSTKGGKRGR